MGNAPAGPKYKAKQKIGRIRPLVPAGFDCSKIHELGIDRMENFRAGAIMIFCREAKDGEPEESDGSAFRSLSTSLLRAHLVGLTWTWSPAPRPFRTSLNRRPTLRPIPITLPIVVAYNDQGVNANPLNISRRIGLDRWRYHIHAFNQSQWSKSVRKYRGRSGHSIQQADRHWLTVWILDGQCAGGLGGYSSTTPWTPIVDHALLRQHHRWFR